MRKIFICFVAIVASMNLNAVVINGIAYDLDKGTNTATVTSNMSQDEYNYRGVTSIDIPKEVTYEGDTYSVTSIGVYAFMRCADLANVTIPYSVIRIGENAFDGCHKLDNVTIGDGVKTIEEYAFSDCSYMRSITIPNSVTSIGDHAFDRCSYLQEITIGLSVTSIGDMAFRFTTKLEEIECLAPEPPTLGENCFLSSGDDIRVRVPKTSVDTYKADLNWKAIASTITGFNFVYGTCGDNLKYTLKDAALTLTISGVGEMTEWSSSSAVPWYSYRSQIKSVVIGDGVKSIGSIALAGCTQVTYLTVPSSVISIGGYAFAGCTGLRNVNIPKGVTSIAEYTFYNCSALTSIDIPSKVATIGEEAFSGCSGLTSITCRATTPPTCDGDNCFDEVNKSIPLYVPFGTKALYQDPAAKGWKEFTNIIEMADPTTALEGVESIRPSAVSGQKILRNGQLFIEKNGELYNANGARVK